MSVAYDNLDDAGYGPVRGRFARPGSSPAELVNQLVSDFPSPRTAAVISAVNPFPADSGKSVVMAGLLEHLRDRLPSGGVHYLHVGRPIANTADFGDIVIHEMGAPDRSEQLRALIRDVGKGGRSLQEAFLASRAVTDSVSRTLAEIRPDLEIIDTLRMQQHVVADAAGRRVLYLDDLFSVRYERMLSHIRSGAKESGFDPLGQFATHLPPGLRGLTQQRHVRRWLLTVEADRIRRSEVTAAQSSSLSLLLNDQEAELLRRRAGASVEVIAPWLQTATVAEPHWDGAPEFVFMGLLSLAHNHDGLTYFLREGLPELLRLVPNARLHVVGRGASEQLIAEAELYGDAVVMHGYVPDLNELLGRACALVNVLRFGSGVKIKVLESLARGLPVVATPIGAEGVTESTRPGLDVVHNALEAAAVMAGLCDPATHREATDGALRLHRELFAEDVVRRRYDEVLGTGPLDGTPLAG